GVHKRAVAEVNVNSQYACRAVAVPDELPAILGTNLPVAAGEGIVDVIITERRRGHVDIARIDGARLRWLDEDRRMWRCISENRGGNKDCDDCNRNTPPLPATIPTTADRSENDECVNHHSPARNFPGMF